MLPVCLCSPRMLDSTSLETEKLGGIVLPNDGKCHLQDNMYTMSHYYVSVCVTPWVITAYRKYVKVSNLFPSLLGLSFDRTSGSEIKWRQHSDHFCCNSRVPACLPGNKKTFVSTSIGKSDSVTLLERKYCMGRKPGQTVFIFFYRSWKTSFQSQLWERCPPTPAMW